MTISIKDNSLKTTLNRANPNTIADEFRTIAVGDVLRSMPTTLRKKNPNTAAVSPYQLATVQTIALPDDAKASTIVRAYARAGGAGTGELAVQAYGTTPGSGQIAVAPNGDIVVLAADALTDLDVLYQPIKADIVEITLPVVAASGLCALPSALTSKGVVQLLEAEVLTGGLVTKMIVLVPTSSAPATTKARMKIDGTGVFFAVADAVTSARLKLAVASAIDVDALLTATANFA